MPSNEHQDERQVEALRRLLNVEEPLPLGMRSRLEARLAVDRRREAKPGFAFPAVLGLAGFIGGSALFGLQVHSPTLTAALVLGSAAYGVGLHHLVKRASGTPPPVAGDAGESLAEE